LADVHGGLCRPDERHPQGRFLPQPAQRGLARHAYLARGDLVQEIDTLKREPGGYIMAHGGASFVQALSRQRLIDEYRLVIRPVAMGSGLALFKRLATATAALARVGQELSRRHHHPRLPASRVTATASGAIRAADLTSVNGASAELLGRISSARVRVRVTILASRVGLPTSRHALSATRCLSVGGRDNADVVVARQVLAIQVDKQLGRDDRNGPGVEHGI